MRTEDYEPFKALIEDLCAAYNRPCTDRVVRVFYESCKGAYIEQIRTAADVHRKSSKKMPTPRDLLPEQIKPARSTYANTDPAMSRWAIGANKVMFQVAYGTARGMVPLGAEVLQRMLAKKAELVRDFEDMDHAGMPPDRDHFVNSMTDALRACL